MNDKKIIRNLGISMIMKPISMALSLVYTPMALDFLGETRYGVWAIILNIVTWINIFDIGIGNGLRNKLTESCANGDYESAQKYVSTAYLGTAFLSLMFCIVINLIWRCFHLSEYFKLTIVGENVDTVISFCVVFVCVNFIFSLSKTSAYAVQKSGAISVVNVLGHVLQIVILFFLSKILNQSLIAIAVMYGIASLFENVVLYRYLTKKRKYLIPHIKYADMSCMKNMMTLGLGFFVMQICAVVLNTTDNLLISNLYGSAEVTPYSMVYKVFYLFVTVHSIILMPMWSAYTEASTRGDIEWIKSTIKKINYITVLLSIGVIIAIFLFEPFAAVWLGKKLVYGKRLIIVVAIFMIAQMIFNNYSAFLCGVGHIKSSTVIAAIETIANIPLSIFFAQRCGMGLSGIIMGSLSVMLIGTILTPIITMKWIRQHERLIKNS